jgi:sugar lactone lactonase YvrE
MSTPDSLLGWRRLPIALLLLASGSARADDFVPHRLYVTDVFRKNVMVFEANGEFLGPLLDEPVFIPAGIAFGPGGEVFLTSSGAETILPLDPQGQLAGPPISSGGLVVGAGALAFGPNGRYYVGSVVTGEVFVISPGGFVEHVFLLPGAPAPAGICFAPNGNLLVAAFAQDLVYELFPAGGIVRTFEAPGLDGPTGIALGPDSRIYVSAMIADAILVFETEGALDDTITSANLDGPVGLAFGPDGRLYAAALDAHRVLVFRTDGALVQEILAPLLFGPQMLAFAPVRVEAKIRGVLSETGQPRQKIRERFQGGGGPALSLFVGLGQAMLTLEDGADPDDLVSLLGTDRLVFPSATASSTPSTLVFLGDQSTGLDAPGGHLDLSVKGKVDPVTGIFEAKSAKGILSVRNGARLFTANVSGSRRIE